MSTATVSDGLSVAISRHPSSAGDRAALLQSRRGESLVGLVPLVCRVLRLARLLEESPSRPVLRPAFERQGRNLARAASAAGRLHLASHQWKPARPEAHES